MSRRIAPEQQARNDRVDRIVELFAAGYGRDYVCEQGLLRGWTRADVLTVVKQRGWELDGSGRLPFHMRRSPERVAQLRGRPVNMPLPAPLEAIARYDEAPRKPVVAEPVPVPAAPSAPRPPAVSQAVAQEAVDRFLAERTIPAADDQYLTGPELRAAYESWRAEAAAPAVTPRSFGVALTAKYRKRQSAVTIDGGKPVCYFGVAWGPTAELHDTETPTEGTAPGTIGADAAGTAPDPSGSGHGYAGPDAQPQVSPSRSQPTGEGGGLGASDAPAELPATDERPIDELLDGWTWNADTKAYVPRADEAAADDEQGAEPHVVVAPPASAPVDILAAALEHAHPAVRAKAKRVQAAIDDLCTALSRHRAPEGGES